MTLAIDTITASIAALSISGEVNGASHVLVIRDTSSVPGSLSVRDCPMLTPHPDIGRFVAEFTVTDQSVGAAGTRKMDVTYTLNYLLVYAPAGGDRNSLISHYDGMMHTIFKIADAVLGMDSVSGAVTVDIGTPAEFVNMEDNGVTYLTCLIPIKVLEFVN